MGQARIAQQAYLCDICERAVGFVTLINEDVVEWLHNIQFQQMEVLLLPF